MWEMKPNATGIMGIQTSWGNKRPPEHHKEPTLQIVSLFFNPIQSQVVTCCLLMLDEAYLDAKATFWTQCLILWTLLLASWALLIFSLIFLLSLGWLDIEGIQTRLWGENRVRDPSLKPTSTALDTFSLWKICHITSSAQDIWYWHRALHLKDVKPMCLLTPRGTLCDWMAPKGP